MKILILLLFLIISCVSPDTYIKKNQTQNIPKFNPMVSLPFEITWLIVRDCVEENKLPIKFVDKMNGEIKTELEGDALGYTAYSITISVNQIKENLQKIYISGYWRSASILFDSAAKSTSNKKITELKDCITNKTIIIDKEGIQERIPKPIEGI